LDVMAAVPAPIPYASNGSLELRGRDHRRRMPTA
jgi:hypothetical protein